MSKRDSKESRGRLQSTQWLFGKLYDTDQQPDGKRIGDMAVYW